MQTKKKEPQKQKWWVVNTGYACYGFREEGGIVQEAAPIGKHLVGMTTSRAIGSLRVDARRRGAIFTASALWSDFAFDYMDGEIDWDVHE